MPRIPLLNGSRLIIADAPTDAVVLRPRPPAEAIADIAALPYHTLVCPYPLQVRG